MDWVETLNRVLAYIEQHMAEPLGATALARVVSVSSFYLQRSFAAVTGTPLMEYVRSRRLSEAGRMLRRGERVLDVALDSGYDTPESFRKAFVRFHGVTPSAARQQGVPLRYLSPLHVHITLTGGSIMEHSMEKIGALEVMGVERRFRHDNAFSEIPKFWCEYFAKGYGEIVPGALGVCFDMDDSEEFMYMIGCFCGADDALPEGFARRTIPAHTWAKFKAIGPTPKAIQRVNRQVYTEWLPNNPEWELASGTNIEVYTEGDTDAEDYVCELWVPVKGKA